MRCKADGVEAPTASTPPRLAGGRRLSDRLGDAALRGLTGLAAAGALLLIGLLVYKVVDGAWPAIQEFGLSFLTTQVWDPVTGHFGALAFIFGTVMTSLGALLVAAPVSIAIGLFLSELAPRSARGVVGTLVELLAAIPSVVLGLWGILVLGPFVQKTLGPFLQSILGWTPFFKGTVQISSYLSAVIVLSIMITPIASSISRELFLQVPRDVKEGAIGLGLTRWEMVRGVMIPFAKAGLVGALLLGLGRAIGEAIAVTQVIGNTPNITLNLFSTGDTLASRIASQYQGAVSNIQIASLFYLAAILLVISLVTNGIAQWIVVRFAVRRSA
jgi:phosphate transport system permease protein